MATIYTKIKRKILQGDFQFSIHCLEELDNDFLTPEDAVAAVLNAQDYDTLTDDETHFRYRFFGVSEDERAIVVIVFLSQGKIALKLAYEDFG